MMSGDACECQGCRGRYLVYCTVVVRDANVRKQYLQCNICRHKPDDNIVVIPLRFAPSRAVDTTSSIETMQK